jgi:hypothetical protein
MLKSLKYIISLMLLIICFIGNGEGGKSYEITRFSSLSDVPTSAWKDLAQKKIYYGHQSVGTHIMIGIKDLVKENQQIRLKFPRSANKHKLATGLFVNSRLGQITDPSLMEEDVTRSMEKTLGGVADIAVLRFSYGDVYARKNVEEVFDDYQTALSVLKKKYPQTKFVHVTLPLETTKTSWKLWVKQLLGKQEIWEYETNIRRNDFNELLRKKHKGLNPVFDIAELQSTFTDGKRSTFTKNGKTYYSMIAYYSYDGHHLNQKGREIAAEKLLLLLASLASQ